MKSRKSPGLGGTCLALGLAWIGCGDPALRHADLVGEWEYEACTWGAEGARQVPCEEFRPLGTVEFRADSSVVHWGAGRLSFQEGRITRMEFKDQGGVLVGRAQGNPREMEAEVRLQEGKLVYSLKLPGGSEGGMQGVAEHGVLRRKPGAK